MASFSKYTRLSLIHLIRLYRYCFSLWLGQSCRFVPTCSQYGIEAIEHFGCWKGCFLISKRLLKCHPWHAGGFDPLKKPSASRHFLTHHRS